MIKKLILGAIGAGIVAIGYFGFYLQSNEVNVGVDLPEAPALFETSLAAPISATATTIPLTSIIVRGGEQLANYNCFTIDEGSAQAEFVCGTISTSTTSLINASRGVSAKDGFTENPALQFAHRRGASVKVTDFPIIQLLRSQNNGDEAFENVLKYASGVVPAGVNELADVGYVLSVVTGGAVSFDGLTVGATAGETISAGQVVYFKTSDQQWYKVDADTSTTYLGVLIGMAQGAGVDEGAISGGVLLNGVDANQTGLTAGNQYYISSTAGEATTTVGAISLGIAKSTTELIFNTTFGNVALLKGNNTFTGTNTFSGTTTFSGTVVFSSSTTHRVYTSSSIWTKPANLSYIIVEVVGGGGAGGGSGGSGGTSESGSGGGGGGYSKRMILASNLSATTSVTVGLGGTSVFNGDGTTGGTSSFGSFAQATGGTGGFDGDSVGGVGGIGTLGDINIKGGGGGPGGSNDVRPGAGGSSILGGGASTAAINNNGNTGGIYGGGGSGSYSGSPNSHVGGSGAIGVVIVTEFFN